MKKILVVIMSFIMVYCFSLTAFAGEKVNIFVDGTKLENGGILIDGRTLVPVRDISEALGANVTWENTQKQVEISKPMYSFGSATGNPRIELRTISMKIGEKKVKVNGIEFLELDVPAQIIDNKTMVPVRIISEIFETKVEWDAVSQTVKIAKPLNNSFSDAKIKQDIIKQSEQDVINEIASSKPLTEVKFEWLSEEQLSSKGIDYVIYPKNMNRPDELVKVGLTTSKTLYKFTDGANDIKFKIVDGMHYFYQDDLLELGILSEPIKEVVIIE